MITSSRRSELALARLEIDRRRVLDAGAYLFADKGFDGTSMASVAREAELSLKALYSVYPGKDELYEAVIADRYEQHVLPLLAVDRHAQPAPEQVLSLIDDVVVAMETDRAFLLLYANGSAGVPAKLRLSKRDPFSPYINAFRDHLIQAIGDCRPDFDELRSRDLAVALAASLVALAVSSFTEEPARPARGVSDTLRELFGSALGADRTDSTWEG